MKLPKELTTVTTFSKLVALMLFVALPFIGFYLGLQYQKALTPYVNREVYVGQNMNYPKATDPNGGREAVGTDRPAMLSTKKPVSTINPTPTPAPEPAISYSLKDGNIYGVEGKVYFDKNCNLAKDWDERTLEDFKVTIFKLPEYIVLASINTDSNGYYNYSYQRSNDQPVQLRATVESQPGYQWNPDYGGTKTFGTVDLNPKQNYAYIYLPQYTPSSIGPCKY